jgi:hypothetical protein
MKAIVISLSNVDPIADGSQLYTCKVDIRPGAPNGIYPLVGSAPGSSDPDGFSLPTEIVDGSVEVGVVSTPTPVTGEAEASLILRRVRLRGDVGIRLGRGLGSAKIEAAVNANLPFGSLIDDVQASGLAINLTTSGTSIDLHWGAGDCSARATARGPKIRCSADDAASGRTVILRPTKTPNVLNLRLLAATFRCVTAVHRRARSPRASPARRTWAAACEGRQQQSKVLRESAHRCDPAPTGTPTRTIAR